MDSVKNYIVMIVAVCLCCGIIKKLAGETGPHSTIINALCGVTLAVTVISAIITIDFRSFENVLDDIQFQSTTYVQTGVADTNNELREIISSKVCAYVLEKASSYDCSISSVQVTLSDDSLPVPNSIVIIGTFSPYVKNHLAEIFESNLGVSKESQQWIYQN